MLNKIISFSVRNKLKNRNSEFEKRSKSNNRH